MVGGPNWWCCRVPVTALDPVAVVGEPTGTMGRCGRLLAPRCPGSRSVVLLRSMVRLSCGQVGPLLAAGCLELCHVCCCSCQCWAAGCGIGSLLRAVVGCVVGLVQNVVVSG